jgi:hypothetical protein
VQFLGIKPEFQKKKKLQSHAFEMPAAVCFFFFAPVPHRF